MARVGGCVAPCGILLGRVASVYLLSDSHPALRPFDETVRNALNILEWLLPKGRLAGSKVVLVKGFMLLSQPKAGEHRPAKSFGNFEVT